MIGAAILLLRFIIRYISFVRIRHRSELISGDGIKIYQVDKEIIPFSFGNAVFINRNQHSEEELKEIVRHEFVHVKQNHTIDIVWAELLCIFNWYNPFAWLLKRSIRQNLEFIADNKVIENGINKKEYQYLLLKVIGNRQFCIAAQFNFSSLKKRIAMMNKSKSAKRQLLRMLFLLPATAVLLLAFRNLNSGERENPGNEYTHSGIVVDAGTFKPISNVKILNRNYGTYVFSDANGFFSFQTNEKGQDLISLIISKDGYRNMTVENISAKSDLPNFLRDMKIVGLNTDEHTNNKGAFISTIPVKTSGTKTSDYDLALQALKKELKLKYHYPDIYDPAHPFDTIPDIKTPNSKGYYIDIKDNKGNCMVVIKDKNKKEVKRLLLTEWNEKDDYYENLYGEILSPTTAIVEEKIKANNPAITTVTVNGNTATVTLKNGKTEVYTLSLKDEKKAFEERCGTKEVAVSEISLSEIEEPGEIKEVTIAEVPVKVTTAELAETVVTGVPLKKAVSTTGEIKEVTVAGKPLTKTIVANPDMQEVVVSGVPLKKAVTTTGEIKEVTVIGNPIKTSVTNIKNPNVNVVSEANTTNTTNIGSNPSDNGELDIKITITKETTPEQFEKLIGQLKEKGYELKFTNKDYNDGMLTQLSGTIKYKGSNSSFSLSDFDQVIIKVYREGDNVEFRIYSRKNKVTL
jgi:hypothetical protein